MIYKSIFTVWDDRSACETSLSAATELTRKNDGHLDVLCLGVDRVQTGLFFTSTTPMVLNDGIEQARNEAQGYEVGVKAALENSGLNWSCQTAVAQLNGISMIVGNSARFNDIVVLPQPYGTGSMDEASMILEAALFEARAPVLVVPETETATVPEKIVIAWNESPESLTAIRASLPFLVTAKQVDIAIVDPGHHAPDRSDPGLEVSRMLNRHDVNVSVSVLARTVPRIADVLQRHCIDFGADMMVMGAYGHSRFRESILGGATRDTLEHVKVPVLMAH